MNKISDLKNKTLTQKTSINTNDIKDNNDNKEKDTSISTSIVKIEGKFFIKIFLIEILLIKKKKMRIFLMEKKA